MPHSADDPPSLPPAESAGNEAPSASPQGAVPDGVLESTREGADTGGALQHDGEPRRPRRRRRRRRPPAFSTPEAAGGAEATPGEPAAVEGAIVAEEIKGALPDKGQSTNPPRRRRRRRRGPPRDPAADPVSTGGDGQAQQAALGHDGEQSAAGGDPARSEGALGTPPQDNLPRQHSRRRYGQRRTPRTAASADQRLGGEPQGGTDAATREGERSVRRPWAGGPRNRSPRDVRPREGEQRDSAPRERSAPAMRREADQGERGQRARGPRGEGSRDRRQGRGRDSPQKKVEQKLYILESVVDRGFEDVAAQAEESVARRIHWTIVKRTVADQKSGKPMSAVYVLQREGSESEFPNLGAARLAVHKTIVHPEKLTLSKAEHAAAKK